ncbi:hypothetical protein GCM10017687_16650 [Streptomyces echinatus]
MQTLKGTPRTLAGERSGPRSCPAKAGQWSKRREEKTHRIAAICRLRELGKRGHGRFLSATWGGSYGRQVEAERSVQGVPCLVRTVRKTYAGAKKISERVRAW